MKNRCIIMLNLNNIKSKSSSFDREIPRNPNEFWFDNQGRRFKPLESYQVPLNTVSQLTGLEFNDLLYKTNPLFFRPNSLTESAEINTPEYHLIQGVGDLILDRDLS
jgi:endonuclease G